MSSIEARLAETEAGWRALAADFSRRVRLPQAGRARPWRVRRGWWIALAGAVMIGAAIPLLFSRPAPPAAVEPPRAPELHAAAARPPTPPIHRAKKRAKKIVKLNKRGRG